MKNIRTRIQDLTHFAYTTQLQLQIHKTKIPNTSGEIHKSFNVLHQQEYKVLEHIASELAAILAELDISKNTYE